MLAVKDFVQKHMTGLRPVMERLSHPDAISSCDALLAATDEVIPAAQECIQALQRVCAILDAVSAAEIARLECEPGRPYEIGAGIRWFGARITDLEVRLQRLT